MNFVHSVLTRNVESTAIIEFEEPAEARAAFKKLAYSKFKNLPLYLEWAPANVFNTVKGDVQVQAEPTATKTEETPAKEQTYTQEEKPILPVIDENWIPEPDTTLFVKNLNFSTTEPALKKVQKRHLSPQFICGKCY